MIDPRKFRMPGPEPERVNPHPPVRRGIFLKGPLDWSWLCKAARLPGRALQVGLALLLIAGMKRSRTVRLSRKYPEQLGLDRHAQYRGLKALEKAGLVTVSRKPGSSPQVTVVRRTGGGG